jgi:hypothetical protein
MNADGSLSVPVNLDESRPLGSTGLTEATLALRFDPSVFTVSSRDIHLGSIPVLGSGWTVTSLVDDVTGQIGITLYSLTPIASNLAGSLVTIDFHAHWGAGVGTGSIQLAAVVDPNGQGSYVTNVADTNGAMILGVAPSNTAISAIEGMVLLSSPVSAVTAVTTPSELESVEPAVVVSVTPPVSVVVESSGEESSVPATNGTADAGSAHSTNTAAHPASAGRNLVVQAGGVVFQVAGNATALAPALTALTDQHLTDRVFLALARGVVDLADLPLVCSPALDAMNQYLSIPQPSATGQGSDLDIFRVGDLDQAGAIQGSRSELVAPRSNAAPATADTAAVTDYFARLADADDAETSDD